MQIRTAYPAPASAGYPPVQSEIREILAEGGLCRSVGVEWLLDNLDRRAEAQR